MDILAISSSYPSTNARPIQSAGADAKIKSLEQQLQKLNVERQKAVRRGDEEQKKKIKDAIKKVTGVSPLAAFAAGKIEKGTVISVLAARKY